MTAIIKPRNASVAEWSVTESVDSPVMDGQSTQTIAQANISRFSDVNSFINSDVYLETDFGSFYGSVKSTNIAPHYVDSGRQSSLVILGLLSAFNTTRSVPPFKGTLNDYIDMLVQLVGYSGKYVTSWDSYEQELVISGFYDNVFTRVTSLLTTINYQWIQVKDAILIRPKRKYVLDWSHFVGTPSIDRQHDVVKKYIRTFVYDQEYGQSLNIYPPKGLYEENDNAIENIDNIPQLSKSLDATNVLSVQDRGAGFENAVVEQTFDISASLSSVNQPICALPPCFRHTFDSGNVVSVYVFMGSWTLLGIESITVDSASYLPTGVGVNAGDLALSRDNNVYYYCTIGYSSTTDSSGKVTETKASWHEFGSFNGDTVHGSVALDEYLKSHDSLDNTQGFYTITGADGYPLMPKQWLDNGGSLVVSVDQSTNKIKVRVTAPNITMKDVSVYAQPPSLVEGLVGKSGDMVAYDPSGIMSANSLIYEWKDSAWSLVQDANPFPYSPYKVAIGTYNGEYNGLYITGNGIRWKKRAVTKKATYTPSDNGLEDKENRIDVDNIFVTSDEKAEEVFKSVDSYGNGVTSTITLTLAHQYGGAKYKKAPIGSFASFDEIMTRNFNAYTYEQVSESLLNLGLKTYEDVTNAFNNGFDYSMNNEEIGNIVGSHIIIDNALAVDVTSVTVSEKGIDVQGVNGTTLGDVDEVLHRNGIKTLGELEKMLLSIGKHENKDYNLGDWSSEPLRTRLET